MVTKTFEYDGKSITLSISGDTNNRNVNYINKLKFTSGECKFTIYCSSNDYIVDTFLKGYGKSYSYIKYGPAKDGTYKFKLKNDHGSFTLTIPMSIAIDMQLLIEEFQEIIDELNASMPKYGY